MQLIQDPLEVKALNKKNIYDQYSQFESHINCQVSE